MEKEIKVVTFTDEEGNQVELEVLVEFNHNDKDYVVLYDNACECECECEDEACDCEEECDDDCDCECDCHDEDPCEGRIYVLEVTKDEEGKEDYKEINETELEELLPIVEKELYPTEEK